MTLSGVIVVVDVVLGAVVVVELDSRWLLKTVLFATDRAVTASRVSRSL